ncbi:ethanolamine ammonia-lyase reactivating factor EutA [Fictibacillus sp. Mic-4]|uniref:ethanolamine ammonia-lyase reactivating factor EutA n=1 Tax=Fictibacillus sp. Mic-4 TaxID=3132826 RepID=UPI003CEE7375
MISAGIDIGTSTTKMVISRFTLTNTAGSSHVPRIEIIDKDVIYKSPIFKTPLIGEKHLINIDAVYKLVQQEYQKAGIVPEEVKTGAVIITGESATKENAGDIIHFLSDKAGDFLVATAGPDLEGVIAAKGSGAYDYSIETGKVIANIDIGGGTANIAIYKRGNLLGTCTLHIGGRLIEFQNERISYVAPSVKQVAKKLGLSLEVGGPKNDERLGPILDFMADSLCDVLLGKKRVEENPLLLGHAPQWGETVEAIMFSGGVSECLYRLEHQESRAIYDDIGTRLAKRLRASERLRQWQWIEPAETVRATVLGAGTQTTEISGATIHVHPSKLPIKNLPVYHVRMEGMKDGESKINNAIDHAINLYDPQQEGNNFALYLTGLNVLRFSEVQALARWLLNGLERQYQNNHPMVIVVANDIAKALGQSLGALKSRREIICIDQIRVENGDYLDIGHMLQSEVVPVVVKTLAFHS